MSLENTATTSRKQAVGLLALPPALANCRSVPEHSTVTAQGTNSGGFNQHTGTLTRHLMPAEGQDAKEVFFMHLRAGKEAGQVQLAGQGWKKLELPQSIPAGHTVRLDACNPFNFSTES